MEKIIPAKLAAGDEIRVIAPARGHCFVFSCQERHRTFSDVSGNFLHPVGTLISLLDP